MKRLTKKADGAYLVNCDNCPKQDNCYYPASCQPVLVDRLAAYEDTGLEPEDMKRALNEDAMLKFAGQALGVTPGRLRELAQAEKEGRCVVLACKVGDMVYTIKKDYFNCES